MSCMAKEPSASLLIDTVSTKAGALAVSTEGLSGSALNAEQIGQELHTDPQTRARRLCPALTSAGVSIVIHSLCSLLGWLTTFPVISVICSWMEGMEPHASLSALGVAISVGKEGAWRYVMETDYL